MTPTAHLLLQESSPHDIYVLKATAAKIVAKESIRGKSNLFYIVSNCATSFYLASMGGHHKMERGILLAITPQKKYMYI